MFIIDITEKPFAMHVVPSEYAFSEKPELVLAPGYNSIYFVDQDQCKDLVIIGSQKEINIRLQELTNGPFTKISISPSYEYFGLFNEKGELWIVNASFTETLTVFETKAVVPPDQIAWYNSFSIDLIPQVWKWLCVFVLEFGSIESWRNFAFGDG